MASVDMPQGRGRSLSFSGPVVRLYTDRYRLLPWGEAAGGRAWLRASGCGSDLTLARRTRLRSYDQPSRVIGTLTWRTLCLFELFLPACGVSGGS